MRVYCKLLVLRLTAADPDSPEIVVRLVVMVKAVVVVGRPEEVPPLQLRIAGEGGGGQQKHHYRPALHACLH